MGDASFFGDLVAIAREATIPVDAAIITNVVFGSFFCAFAAYAVARATRLHRLPIFRAHAVGVAHCAHAMKLRIPTQQDTSAAQRTIRRAA